MTETPKFKYFKCNEGPALELLKAYQDELTLLSAGHVKLHREFQERADALQMHHQGNLRSMWMRLSALVGLDPEKTWGNPEYQIEARYLEDGFGALLFTPLPQVVPLQSLLEGELAEPPDDDPHGEVAPDKERLN